ncbi:DUF538 family protein [Zea mays]|uniref:DUF538 family protein n=1 Tax=Zea mays TaxID=4577 RepID=A0A1D6JZN3_MAIZE|nr:DUF538 family protein [Zea mays]
MAGEQAEGQDAEAAGGPAQGAQPPRGPVPARGDQLRVRARDAAPDGVHPVPLRGRLPRRLRAAVRRHGVWHAGRGPPHGGGRDQDQGARLGQGHRRQGRRRQGPLHRWDQEVAQPGRLRGRQGRHHRRRVLA